MNRLRSELTSLPLHEILAAPLTAAIEAQQEASLALVSFIREVGFVEDDEGVKTAHMIAFHYTRPGLDADGNTVDFETTLKIPLLAMIPLPMLTIDTLEVNFLVEIEAVTEAELAPDVVLAPEIGKQFPFLKHHSRLRVAPTARTQARGQTRTTRSYDLEISLKASSDEQTQGIQRILTALTGIMTEDTT